MRDIFPAIFAVLLMLAAVPTWAADRALVLADPDGNRLTLVAAPCTAPDVLPRVPPGVSAAQLLTAHMLYEGRRLNACWQLLGGYVFVVDSDGDVLQIPARYFRPAHAL